MPPKVRPSESTDKIVAAATGGYDKRFYEDIFLKPAVTAGVGTLATQYLLFNNGEKTVNIFGGVRVPVWAATAAAMYGAGVIGELLAQKVLPHVARDEKYKNNFMQGLVQPGAVGAANAALWMTATSAGASEKGVAMLFGLGALAEVAGDYIYNHFVLPMV